jgi:hypothetical protein
MRLKDLLRAFPERGAETSESRLDLTCQTTLRITVQYIQASIEVMRGCLCLRGDMRENDRISHLLPPEPSNSTQTWTNIISLFQSQVLLMAEPQGSLGNTKRQLRRV